jgi:hypothetical protein
LSSISVCRLIYVLPPWRGELLGYARHSIAMGKNRLESDLGVPEDTPGDLRSGRAPRATHSVRLTARGITDRNRLDGSACCSSLHPFDASQLRISSWFTV